MGIHDAPDMCTSLMGHRAKAHSVSSLSPSHSNRKAKCGEKRQSPPLIILAAAICKVFLILNIIITDIYVDIYCGYILWIYMWIYVDIYCQKDSHVKRKKKTLTGSCIKNGNNSMLFALKRGTGIGHLFFPLVNTKEAQVTGTK